MRFHTLKSATVKGHKTRTLLNPDGSENLAFSIFRDSLLQKVRGPSINSIDSYLLATADFLDFLHAYVLANGEDFLTEYLINDALEHWDEYLVDGELSEEFEITEVCKLLPSPRLSPNSSAIKHAGLKKFLKASSKVRKAYEGLQAKGLLKGDMIISGNDLIEIPQSELMPQKQRAAIISKSVLAGVIKGGPKMITPAIFPSIQGGKDSRPFKAFPYDKINDLLKTLTNDRDRALFALTAASGCRIHEALRVLTTDIDIKERKVYLVDPKSRLNDGYYDSFSAAQRKVISTWKGRNTEITFLIEPFKSLFFEYAESYFKNEKPADVDHDFFFCCLDNDSWGKPFLFAHPSSIRDGFNKAKRKVLDSETKRLGPHSLRHTYGFFLKNFCPRIDGGYGLDLHLVQKLMGHASIESTKKYAEYDITLAELELTYANALVYDLDENKSINTIKKDILLKELKHVDTALQLEEQSRQNALESQIV